MTQKESKKDKNYGPEAQDTADAVTMEELKEMCLDKLREFRKKS